MAELELYFHPSSHFSQRVVMALEELGVQFERKIVNLFDMENHRAWFIRMNRNGQVPLLRVTSNDKFIPESEDIIKYVDGNYGNGKLCSIESEENKETVAMAKLIDSINVPIITFGSFFNEEFVQNRGINDQVLQKLKGKVNAGTKVLEEEMQKCPELADIYMEKIRRNSHAAQLFKDKTVYCKAVEQCKGVLEEVNQHLTKAGFPGASENQWLFGDKFTLADIYLSTVLARLVYCGYGFYMWEEGKLTGISSYLDKVRQRKSYVAAAVEKTIPPP